MLHTHAYPICEYDTCREGVIRPEDFMEKDLPRLCVITFFRRELEAFAAEKGLPLLGVMHSEVADLPIYGYGEGEEHICIAVPFACSAGAAGTIEELRARGCEKFLICGGAGCIKSGLELGQVIVPTAAVRDEGASYHYLPPAREVDGHGAAIAAVCCGLEKLGVPYMKGKTWTTDAMCRETPEMVRRRREEGCLTVEMETAAFFALSQFYDLPLAQLLYAGDDVSGQQWDSRNWNGVESVRSRLIRVALELVKAL